MAEVLSWRTHQEALDKAPQLSRSAAQGLRAPEHFSGRGQRLALGSPGNLPAVHVPRGSTTLLPPPNPEQSQTAALGHEFGLAAHHTPLIICRFCMCNSPTP